MVVHAYLARNKRSSQDPNKESKRSETLPVGNKPCHCCRNRAGEQNDYERPSWTKSVAKWTGDEAHDQSALVQQSAMLLLEKVLRSVVPTAQCSYVGIRDLSGT